MDHDALEQQTAPESTRGLFDFPETGTRSSDRRRTFQGPSSSLDYRNANKNNTMQRPQAVSMLPPTRRHQRSRSAVNSDLIVTPSKSTNSLNNSNNGRNRRSFIGLQTLKEEIHTADNIKDVINTLKNLPPITPPLSSKSLEKRSSDESMASREAALAEAEAKLMGTFNRQNGDENYVKKRLSLQQLPVLNENGESFMESSNNKRSIINSKSLSLSLSGSSNKQLNRHSASRNFDDWRNSTSSINSNKSSFSLVPFTPTRVNFSRDDANPHQRRPLFIAHLPFSALTPLFRSRQLVRGMLRVNKRNRSDAYVSCDELDGSDIYICGSRDRNRALEGDVVAVRLVNVEKVLREKQEKEDAKLARNNGQPKVRLPDEEDENEIIFGGDEEIDIVKPKYAGVVVAILERAQNQVFSGTLTLSRPNNKRAQMQEEEGDKSKKDAPRIVWFKATDKRVPLIAIPIEQVPEDFVENTEAYANRLFVGSIKRWPITSLHPFGTLETELGPITDLDVQVKAILADANVTDAPFTEPVMQCNPPTPFSFIPSAEENRRDLTTENHCRMITIDPAGSTLFEDGITVVRLGDDTFEVGVHVCDISYFIKPHSPLDKEARARGVHVYLDHKQVPMLPAELADAANFTLNELKPAMSIIWKLSTDGTLLDTWFGKTIVRSNAQLSYGNVEKIIDGSESQGEEIDNDIRLLHRLATRLYENRYTKQAMSLAKQRIIYDDPTKPSMATISDKNPEIAKIIKEFLFLANQSVAQKISSQYPEQALLRRQSPPDSRKINELKEYASNYLNVELDITSATTIQNSVQKIENPELRQLISILVLKTIEPPKYFCAGAFDILKYSHFAIGAPLFTHFTAPLRRYADIIVHRQLEAALVGDKHFYLACDTIQKLAQHCNVKKEASLEANHQGKLLSLALYLVSKQQPQTPESTPTTVYGEARVIAVMEDWFDVSLPEFGLERRIHLANLPLWRHQYDPKERALTMYWKEGVLPSTGQQQQWSLSDDEYEEEELLSTYPEISRSSASLEANDEMNTKQFEEIASAATRAGIIGGDTAKKSKSKRASIISSRLSASTGYSSEQSSQTIKAMDKIRIMVTIEMVRTPPLIRLFAANPYA
ncbi:hypothetical protein G6F57_000188 [Rhizopus arrhizus]|uniref:RNB domain-containing protein n=1 Tax=Rhizopus oryzae TaxID=64495 RepID=A0A9P6XJQ4_RHIOR|nr:hypothetical protein G6F23_001164 [Rhizopus arrhizus]KAG1427028.1 hypothetical protein G6F58_001216 [Rhizopus delemar]KAG0763729.1 hypothetical protein G6F24_005794 [Rhizopus arrhizus]KAG0790342.1 hypothetical protein G6F21_005879 [Rhizopus arrhizus]KAG0814864.1 hypothetical protein G6F20_004440 [Rhizopus arrhizus]